jgi:hypothetical protein
MSMKSKKHSKKMQAIKYGLGSAGFFIPLSVFAEASWCTGGDCTFKSFVDFTIGSIFKPIVPTIVGLTVVFFLWGTYEYIFNGGDQETRQKGRLKMLMGIVALAVMMTFWAFARMLKETFF